MEGPRHYHHYYHGKPAETLGDQLRTFGFWTLMITVVAPALLIGGHAANDGANPAQVVGCTVTGALVVPLGVASAVADFDGEPALTAIGDVICPAAVDG